MDLTNDVRRLASIGTFFIIVGWVFVVYSLLSGLAWWIDLVQRPAFNIFEAFAISAGAIGVPGLPGVPGCVARVPGSVGAGCPATYGALAIAAPATGAAAIGTPGAGCG